MLSVRSREEEKEKNDGEGMAGHRTGRRCVVGGVGFPRGEGRECI